MRIAMIGSGYVGLVSGVCFADFGHDVVCVDTDGAKIAALEAAGVELVSAERIHGRLTRENAGYLAAKRDRAGHRIDATLVAPPARTAD